jgi:hypothetical protein
VVCIYSGGMGDSYWCFFSWWGICFAAVALVAEGLEVLDCGLAALAPGEDVVDVENCIGVGGGGSAALDAFEVVTLEDAVAKAHGGLARGARGTQGMGAGMRGGSGVGIVGPGCEGEERGAPGAEAAGVGVTGNGGGEIVEGGFGGLMAEGAPDFFHLGEEFLVGDAIAVTGAEAGLGEGVVPVTEAANEKGDGEAAGLGAVAAGAEVGAGGEGGDAAEVGADLFGRGGTVVGF